MPNGQDIPSPIKLLNLIMAFLLEMSLLLALGYWGLHTGNSSVMHWLLGLGAPILTIMAWSSLGAPKSIRRLKRTPLAIFRTALFTLAAGGLIAARQKTLGTTFEIVSIANIMLAFIWKQ